MDKSGKGKNVVSILLTLLVVGIYLVPNFAEAIDITLTTKNLVVDLLSDAAETFTIDVKINDGEFLPILYTNLTFSEGSNKIT